jgi:hypothetical protein
MKAAFPVSVVVLLFAVILLGQSSDSEAPSETFHVRGTISGPLGSEVLPGAKINFQNVHETRTVIADGKGSYEVDLPLGLYTITAPYEYVIEGNPERVHEQIVRPPFRVESPTRIVFNISMCAQRLGEPPSRPAIRGHIGGETWFTVPSSEFQVYIRYPTRPSGDGVYIYDADQLFPLLVEYNLFTLRAEHVVYDSKNQTIEASGNVMVTNEFGETQHATSVAFKLSDGQAAPAPLKRIQPGLSAQISEFFRLNSHVSVYR